MANLNGQNIGTNYKGFLNLDSTINTPLDATLRAVTDGMGTSSVLQLSTEQVGISRTVALSAGATNPRLFNEVYTINNSGAQTGTATGIFLNATETALNGMTHNLMDLQVGGSSKFKVSPQGTLTAVRVNVVGGAIVCGFINNGDDSVSVFSFSNTTGATTFGGSIFRLGGTTSSFPAIKRNGAAIDFRLADDSGYASTSMWNLNCLGIIYYGGNGESIASSGNSGWTDFRSNQGWQFTNANGTSVYQRFTSAGISFGDSTLVASAQVTINSTTKGFLMPRQTTAQINAISTPANGLQVYNTDLNVICFYDGTGWHKVTHTNM